LRVSDEANQISWAAPQIKLHNEASAMRPYGIAAVVDLGRREGGTTNRYSLRANTGMMRDFDAQE
jgi:hypothetical protein